MTSEEILRKECIWMVKGISPDILMDPIPEPVIKAISGKTIIAAILVIEEKK